MVVMALISLYKSSFKNVGSFNAKQRKKAGDRKLIYL
mgnify:FL=1